MKTVKIQLIAIALSTSLYGCQNTSNPSSEMKDSSAVSTADNISSDSAAGTNAAGDGSMNTVKGIKEQDERSDLKNETNESNIDDDGAAFIKEAGLGGMMEVELGKLAQKAHITAMKALKGAEFDKHYMDMMVNDHVKTLALFKSAATLRDDKVKDFAAKTLPVLQGHHQLAVQIKSAMK